MTPEERQRPELIGKRRSLRIAKGSGRTQAEVRQLLKQFGEMQKMMGQVGKMAKKGGGRLPPGMPNLPF